MLFLNLVLTSNNHFSVKLNPLLNILHLTLWLWPREVTSVILNKKRTGTGHHEVVLRSSWSHPELILDHPWLFCGSSWWNKQLLLSTLLSKHSFRVGVGGGGGGWKPDLTWPDHVLALTLTLSLSGTWSRTLSLKIYFWMSCFDISREYSPSLYVWVCKVYENENLKSMKMNLWKVWKCYSSSFSNVLI